MSLTVRLQLLLALVCALTGTPAGITLAVVVLAGLATSHRRRVRRLSAPGRPRPAVVPLPGTAH